MFLLQGTTPATNVPGVSTIFATSRSQLSLAAGNNACAVASPAASSHSTVRSRLPAVVVHTGAVVSITVITCVYTALVFPHASVTTHVFVYVPSSGHYPRHKRAGRLNNIRHVKITVVTCCGEQRLRCGKSCGIITFHRAIQIARRGCPHRCRRVDHRDHLRIHRTRISTRIRHHPRIRICSFFRALPPPQTCRASQQYSPRQDHSCHLLRGTTPALWQVLRHHHIPPCDPDCPPWLSTPVPSCRSP